ADLALLVPNCPVCHQSVSLVARHLEANGVPTVVMGCARDIVEHVGVPRFLFSDFPLGNSAGKPFDAESQRDTLTQALTLFDTATGPRTTRVSPQIWDADAHWKDDFLNIETMPSDELARRRAEFMQQKAVAKHIREVGR
ncbi:MAG: glycine reductase, partial [Proteobacteria bacterium]|nr:glycine reductase [Pseudomonadota bacterium]